MVLIRRSGKPYSFLSSALYILSTEKVGMSHLITNHWLQCGVLVLQCGGVWPGALGHHLLLIVIHWQSLSHLLYVFPQWGDGLPYQQEDYQPGWCLLITRVRRGEGAGGLTRQAVRRPRSRAVRPEGPWDWFARWRRSRTPRRVHCVWEPGHRSSKWLYHGCSLSRTDNCPGNSTNIIIT